MFKNPFIFHISTHCFIFPHTGLLYNIEKAKEMLKLCSVMLLSLRGVSVSSQEGQRDGS